MPREMRGYSACNWCVSHTSSSRLHPSLQSLSTKIRLSDVDYEGDTIAILWVTMHVSEFHF